MKVEQFATVIPLLPFDTQTMIIRKQPSLHGIGVCDKIKTYAMSIMTHSLWCSLA